MLSKLPATTPSPGPPSILPRKTRRMASRRSVQKGGVLYASEARKIAAVRVEDELAKAKALVEKAAKAEVKKQRKVFLDAVMAKRSEIMKARTARKRLRVELGKESEAKAPALKKHRACIDSQKKFRSTKLIFPLAGTL